MNSLKLLFLSTEFPPGPGGIANHAFNIAKGLNRKYCVHMMTISDYTSPKDNKLFDNNHSLYIHRFKRYRFSILTIIKRILDILYHIKKYNYSYILLSGKFSIYLSKIISFFSAEKKTIVILHGSELLPSNKLSKFFLSYNLNVVNAIISVSHYTQGLIPKGVNKKKNKYVIPNGVNSMVKAYRNKQSINLEGSPCLLTVGSITKRKGQINLVMSLPEIIKKYPDTHYHCVGLPIQSRDIESLAKELGVNNKITIHGFLEDEQLHYVYKNADILIILSDNDLPNDVEGFGIVILEANTYGISAIGSENTGIEDAIVNNKTGILVDPNNSIEILSAIDKILKNKNNFSKNAIDWSIKHDWKNIIKRYMEIIDSV